MPADPTGWQAVLQARALDGWAALEREACLVWLRRPGIPRSALEDLLMSSFFAAFDSAARHDDQARAVLSLLR